MDVRILRKEFPFLEEFLNKESIREMDVKRFGKEILNLQLYENSHSWAGSYGLRAILVFKDGRFEKCQYGGWYSDNGRSVKEDPPIALWRNFLTERGKIDEEKLEAVEAVVVNDWNWYNNPSNEYDEYQIYVRPRRKEIRLGVKRELEKEISRLRDLVG